MILVEKFGKRWATSCAVHAAVGENTTVSYAIGRARGHRVKQGCTEAAYVIERIGTAKWKASAIEPDVLREVGIAKTAPLARKLAAEDSPVVA